MKDLDEIQRKYNLVTSNEWQEIRTRALNHIVRIGNSQEPVLIQGMLTLINTIDAWEDDFLKEKKKIELQNKG